MEFSHGGDIYRYDVQYDFSANINPLGMPKECVAAAKKGVDLSFCYPDYAGEELCEAICKHEQVKKENIILGNGAAELIYAFSAGVRPSKALLLAPTFSEYSESLLAMGCEIDYYNLSEGNQFQLDTGVLKKITRDIDVMFLCNPNNPTGQIGERNLLLQIANKCKECRTLLLMDECFLDFVEEKEEISLIPYLLGYDNLVVLKAFTKIYGMPGLRLGYALSSNEHLLGKMKACLQPWNTSIPAQMAGIAALEAHQYLEHTYRIIKEERNYLLEKLKNGLAEEIYGSSANYIFFKAEIGLKEKLLQEKILIRDCSNYKNLEQGYYRIAIRTHLENKQLIAAWKKVKGVL